ncbi:oligosaccharide flippase family protein [Sporosarcina siberiensis]|uniref:Oligosaccharide flippase family protein n=1 Tax=Sporosarcina siberiensis TaxID=1365606 RepID=A0ABW4SLE4_9BACL
MNNTFVKSTLILSIATLISKILGSVFRIPLQNIAGDEVLGIFTLVYPVYMVALTLSVAGIPVAISKLITEARVKNDHDGVDEIYRTASVLTLLFGVLSFSLIMIFSNQIANLLGGPSVKPALIIVSITLLIAPYMSVYRGYFQGFENMMPTAVSQVIEQFVRVGLILILAVVLVGKNYGSESIAGGIMIGSSLGALASLIYLQWLFKKNRKRINVVKRPPFSFGNFIKTSKLILLISLPISIGAITMALVNLVDSLTIPMSLLNANVDSSKLNYLYGIYGRGLSLVQIVTVLSASLVLPLIPLITRKLAENDLKATRRIIEKTHFVSHLISWPAAFGLFALTVPLNIALFTNTEGSYVLAVIGISSVFTSLAILGTGILQGMNLAKHAAYIVVAAVILKVVTNSVFIKQLGLVGAAYSTLLIYILIFFINSYVMNRRTTFTMWSKKHTMIVVSTLLMATVIGVPTLYFEVELWSRKTALLYSAGAIFVGVIVYFTSLMVTNVIDRQDLLKIPVLKNILLKLKK